MPRASCIRKPVPLRFLSQGAFDLDLSWNDARSRGQLSLLDDTCIARSQEGAETKYTKKMHLKTHIYVLWSLGTSSVELNVETIPSVVIGFSFTVRCRNKSLRR